MSQTAEVSEAEIAVHWQEENYVNPPERFVAQANLTDQTIFERFSLDNFPDCFKEYADLLGWYRPWDVTLDASNPPFWRWFVGGTINASYNCVDRHLAKYKNKTAIHFVPEPEHEPIQHVTYGELYVRVNEVAALLRDGCGLKKGDRVTLHMPMVPELPITMLACARLGVIHSQVFSGFSGKATADRIVDSESRVLITMDAYYRGGQLLDQKEKADIAVSEAEKEGVKVEKVLVWQRYPGRYSSKTPLVGGRDFVMNELLSAYRRRRVDPVEMLAEDPLFLMYTSGTTGRPKGCQHSTGGYLSYVAGTSKYIQDIHPEDVYWCMADIGWITGHSYIVYGPLALAASSVVYEGLPTYPDAGRPWRIAEELDVNIFHTSPTAIRALRRAGPDEPLKYSHHFKHMTTVGGVPGIHPIIYDEVGNEIPPRSGRAGNICIQNPWPGTFQTIWKNPDRYVEQYYARYCKDRKSRDWRDWPYFCNDGALQAADGYYRILGRIDDVINVAGHRLGTKEIESASLLVDEIAEAAVVPARDDIKGKIPDLYVSLKPGLAPNDAIRKRVEDSVIREIGAIARPRRIVIVPDMPKTRSGKIMRRVLAAISNNEDAGDISTLANPEIVDEIRKMKF